MLKSKNSLILGKLQEAIEQTSFLKNYFLKGAKDIEVIADLYDRREYLLGEIDEWKEQYLGLNEDALFLEQWNERVEKLQKEDAELMSLFEDYKDSFQEKLREITKRKSLFIYSKS